MYSPPIAAEMDLVPAKVIIIIMKIETMENSLEEAKVKAQGSEEKKVKIEAELQKTKDEIKVEADALRAQLKELEGVNDDIESLGEDDQEPEANEGGLV